MEDKCVLVTGSSSGIGYEITSKLLDLGAKVIGIARNCDKSNLKNKNYTKYNCDVSVRDKLEILLKQILKNQSDAILIDRGDLSRETSISLVPLASEHIIEKCVKKSFVVFRNFFWCSGTNAH